MKPEISFKEFVETIYSPKCRRTRSYCQMFLRRIAAAQGRTPLVSDIVGEYEFARSRGKSYFDTLKNLWRCAFEKGYLPVPCPVVDSRKRTRVKRLSDAEGTLCHVMTRQYFPRNVRLRSENTKYGYDLALREFRDCLGHEPVLADLTDENVERLQVMYQQRGLAAPTINERVGRIIALWNWMAKKRMVPEFPAVKPLSEPKVAPVAWTQAQLQALFESCRREPGVICGVPAALWWEALHAFIWDSGERIGAVLRIRWDCIDWETGFVTVPAAVRKGTDREMVYSLHPETLALLQSMREPARELVFPTRWCEGSFYHAYNRILKRANLPTDRKSKLHRMRRSVASHLQANGVDASIALAHSSPTITRESYLDPRIVSTRKTHEVLFRPLPPKT